jgi:AAA family ATP:ADP antiporter
MIMSQRSAHRWVDVRANERRVLIWSFLYFFSLLGGYYMLRPVRDALAVTAGRAHLSWMFTGTFVVMLLVAPLFGALVARLPRQRFVPWAYRFFLLNLVVFAALIHLDVARVGVAYAYFSWLSVYNLFVVSVFWSVMADVFRNEQGKRLFGMISAGGTMGALVGGWFTSTFAETLGLTGLLLLAAALLEGSVQCFFGATRAAREPARAPASDSRALERGEPAIIGGGVLAGVVQVLRSPYLAGICLYVLCMATVQTFLYIQRADIVAGAFSTDEQRTGFFALLDVLVSLGTLLLQVMVTAPILRWLGVGAALAILPVFSIAGVTGLALMPVLSLLVVFESALRAANYALGRPAREVLFTVVTREQKYKSKSFIDTVVYRFGDMTAGWAEHGLTALGLGLAGVAMVTAPLAALWLGCALLLGRAQEARAEAQPEKQDGAERPAGGAARPAGGAE